MTPTLPDSWQPVLGEETQKQYYQDLQSFLARERRAHTIYPPEADVFNAFRLTPFQDVKVMILGQDPYHGEGQAHGLAFSVRPGVPSPPSLLNIFRELKDDLGLPIPNHGCLIPWAEQGVLLLNAVLTVRAHKAASHQGHGWETFTDAVIQAVSQRTSPVVFVLWGNFARQKVVLIDDKHNPIISGPHPSPLSARRGFFGSHPFSRINAYLRESGQAEIDWQLPDL